MVPGSATATFDPHVHTAASYDGREPPELVVEQAAAVGLDAVAITDHDTMAGVDRALHAGAEFGVTVVPGVELSTAHGHLLGIGVDAMPEPGRPLEASVAAIREQGGVAVVPHPFQRSRHGVRRRNLTDCDAVETYNAWLLTGYRNRRATAFAARNGYPGVAGSDAHRLSTLGRAYTEVTLDRDRESVSADALVAAVREGATGVQGRRAAIRSSVGHMATAAGRKTAATLALRSLLP